MKTIITIPSINPTFADVKDTPKSPLDALWMVSVISIPVVIWSIKTVIGYQIKIKESEFKNALRESEYERKREAVLIQNLIEQNKALIKEREDSRIRRLNDRNG